LFPSAFAIAKKRFPGMGWALVILPVRLVKGLDEFIGAEFLVQREHKRDSFR
jgi:hypothetical protein